MPAKLHIGHTNKSLLVGIVIDVSSSMRGNWKNTDGRPMPKVEVIKDALNRQVRKIKSLYSVKPSTKDIELFCIGMGFKRPIVKGEIFDTSENQEKPTGKTFDFPADGAVVCDVIALTEIIPTKADLLEIEDIISKKWAMHSDKLLAKINFRDSLLDELVIYIRESLKESALKRMHRGLRWKALRFLQFRTFWLNSNWLNKKARNIRSWTDNKEKQIESKSFNESFSYVKKIRVEAEKIFNTRSADYRQYIQETLKSFVSNQSNRILELLTLGHSPLSVFETFDEEKVESLAKDIYNYLENDISPKIVQTWASSQGRLIAIAKLIGGRIDNKKVKFLTEESVKKIIWEQLRPFVKTVVIDIFKNEFTEKAKEKFYEWVELSSGREVVRLLSDIANILPDALEKEIYSDEFMFGLTPISRTLKKVSLRFTDKRYAEHEKILVIISDGDFHKPNTYVVSDMADLLRKSGVTILSLHISTKNVISRLVERAERNWSDGAKIMLDISSFSANGDAVSKALRRLDYQIQQGKKLFIQINHSQALEDILDALLIDKE